MPLCNCVQDWKYKWERRRGYLEEYHHKVMDDFFHFDICIDSLFFNICLLSRWQPESTLPEWLKHQIEVYQLPLVLCFWLVVQLALLFSSNQVSFGIGIHWKPSRSKLEEDSLIQWPLNPSDLWHLSHLKSVRVTIKHPSVMSVWGVLSLSIRYSH